MALVTSIKSIQKERQSVHRPTRCYGSILESGGERYVQLDTVGTDERQIPDKISQTIQFNRESASQLITIMKEAFPGIV